MADEISDAAQPDATTATAPGADAPQAPWEKSGEPFDPERAWNRIQAQKTDLDQARVERDELKAKIKAFEDAQLTEQQRAERDAAETKANAESLAAENAILKAIIAHPELSRDDIELLQGIPADAVEERAAKLAARLGAGTPTNPVKTRPTAALRGGADPTAPISGGNDWLRSAIEQSRQ